MSTLPAPASLVLSGCLAGGLARSLARSLVGFLAGCLALAPGVGAAQAAEPPPRSLDTAEPSPPPPDRTETGLRAGDWLVRGRLMGTIPVEQTSRIAIVGGQNKTPTALLPDGDVSYFLTDHIAIEGQVGAVRIRPKIRNSLVGDLAIGSIWNAAAMAIVQYHLLPGARFNPYLGVGVAVTAPIAINPAKEIPDFSLKAQTSAVLQAGFDYHLVGNWFGNASAKYVFVPRQSYTIAGVAVAVDLNMFVVGAGLGYRF